VKSAAAVGLLPALAVLVPALVLYEHQPPPAHTGGFGEPSCASCHFDNELNAPGGLLEIEGLPDGYTPGERYLLSIVLQRPELRRGGFQLASRFAAGEEAGSQAGALRAVDERVEVVEAGGVSYARHTRAGSREVEGATTRWQLEWTAPTRGGVVSLNVAANAANGDASEFGDFIQLVERRVTPIN
jgi:hypothetical protein